MRQLYYIAILVASLWAATPLQAQEENETETTTQHYRCKNTGFRSWYYNLKDSLNLGST